MIGNQWQDYAIPDSIYMCDLLFLELIVTNRQKKEKKKKYVCHNEIGVRAQSFQPF